VCVRTIVEYDTHLGPLGGALDSVLVSHLVRREIREGLKGLKRHAEADAMKASAVAPEALTG